MFINRMIRIGHGDFANGFLDNGRLFFFVNTGSAVLKKELIIDDNKVSVVSVSGENYAMSEILPISSDIQIGRYEKGVKFVASE